MAPIAFSSKDYGGDAEFDLLPTLRAGGHHGSHANSGIPPAIAFDSRQDPVSSTEVFGALGSTTPQAQSIAYSIQAGALRINPNSGPDGVGVQADIAYTMEARAEVQAVCITGNVTHTLKAEGFDASEDGTGRGQQIVATGTDIYNGQITGDIAATIGTRGSSTNSSGPSVLQAMAVRRLTPVECERLQSFPDGYTSIPTWNGWRAMGEDETPEGCVEQGLEVRQNKKTGKWRVKDVDGPRYKALGNSMCVYNMRWIGRRIDAQLRALEVA